MAGPGRPSKLSDKQWAEIQKRLLNGEKAGALAKEFNVARSTISDKFSAINGKVKYAANQILRTEAVLGGLSISGQIAAISLADEMRAISTHLAGAGKLNAMTSHRLAGIANMQVDKIDEANPMESQETLQAISALTKMSNDASMIGINLLNANKDIVKESNTKQKETNVKIEYEIIE
jgi:hypothetical protein